jgi:hypothetical protein
MKKSEGGGDRNACPEGLAGQKIQFAQHTGKIERHQIPPKSVRPSER